MNTRFDLRKISIVFLFVVSFIFLVWFSSAYMPSDSDLIVARSLQQKIDGLFVRMWQNRFWIDGVLRQVDFFKQQKASDERAIYFLDMIEDLIKSRSQRRFSADKKLMKRDFVQLYWSWIATTGVASSSCVSRFDWLHDLADKYDLPVELIIATRSIEYRCQWGLPLNGYWPFQIITANYGTWVMDDQLFEKTVSDLSLFVNNKRKRFNNIYADSGYVIRLSSWWFDIDSLTNHAILYNALSGSIYVYPLKPRNPNYVYGNLYSWSNSWTWLISDWFLTRFIKILKWEVDNYYY